MPNETTPNELGDVAVGSVDNPYPDRIENPEKAQAMAEAGDELRTAAVENRRTSDGYEARYLDEKANTVESNAGDRFEIQNPESLTDDERVKLAEQAAAGY